MKYLITPFLCIGIIWLIVLYVMYLRIDKLASERDRYRNNSNVLMEDIEHYRTSDSLNAAKVHGLGLSISEYKKYRAHDAQLISELRGKFRDMERVTTLQSQTINELRGNVRDSIVYLPGDTIKIVLRCIDVMDKWYELHGCISGGVFTGKYINRDSILIVETPEYKRFMGFLWKTKKVKKRELNVVSRNPNTHILGIELITIK